MNLTKLALKRPVSVILIILALAVFGLTSIPDFKMQLIPDMDMPMLIVMTTYVGADPESVEELVTSVVEDAGATLNGIETVTSQSSENVSMVLFSYEYGVDIDECYSDLRTALDSASLRMPEDAGTPVVIELNMNQTADMTLSALTEDNIDLRKKNRGRTGTRSGIHCGCGAGFRFRRSRGLYPGFIKRRCHEAVRADHEQCGDLSGCGGLYGSGGQHQTGQSGCVCEHCDGI